MSVKSFDFEDVVGFEFRNCLEEDFQEFFFFISEEMGVVDHDSFDFSLEFELKVEGDGDKDLLVFEVDLLNGNLGFSFDLDDDQFNMSIGGVLEFKSLNNKPVSPVKFDTFEFGVE
jgi:hypothetical protein